MLASEIIGDLKRQLEDDLRALQAVKKGVLQALEILTEQEQRLKNLLE